MSDVVNMPISALERSVLNQRMGLLKDQSKDFDFSWIINNLRYLKDPNMSNYRSQYLKNVEDLRVKEGKLRKLAPRIEKCDKEVSTAEGALANAQRKYESEFKLKA